MNLLKLVKPIKDLVVPDRTAFRRVWFGPASGCTLSLNPKDDLWIMLGLYEPEIRPFVGRLVEPGMTCYDLGAADGYYTLALAKHVGPAGEVIAVEADEARLAALKDALTYNEDIAERITTMRAFVGATHDPKGDNVSLDGLVEEGTTPPPAFIKMDVEGAELSILQGAREVLREHGPTLIIEVHSAQLERDCKDLLDELGYTTQVILPDTRFLRDTPKLHRRWFVSTA